MNTSNNYYIHISCENIPHYLSHAHIAPSIFYENRHNDFQSNQSNILIFSNKKWHANYDCSLEVLLPKDIILTQLNSEYFYYDWFIPISRLKSIFYCNKELMENVMWVTREGTTFIPDRLFIYEEKSITDSAESVLSIQNLIIDNEKSINLKRAISNYNRILGAFALSKLIRNNYFDTRLTYSLTFIELLVSINNTTCKEISSTEFTINKINGLFNNSINSDWIKLKKFLNSEIKNDFVLQYSLNNGIQLKEIFNKILLDQVQQGSILYYLIILATYGEGRAKSLDDFFADIEENKIPKKYKETAILLLGLYTGYYKLRHLYNFSYSIIPVKFELNSQLDYVAIECIYIYVQNSSNTDTPIDFNIISLPDKEYNIIDNSKYKGLYVYNTNVITSADFDFMSKEYILNLKEKYGNIENQELIKNHINKILELHNLSESKEIIFRKLTINFIMELFDKILDEVMSDYIKKGLKNNNNSDTDFLSYSFEDLIDLAKVLKIKNVHNYKDTQESKKKLIKTINKMRNIKETKQFKRK